MLRISTKVPPLFRHLSWGAIVLMPFSKYRCRCRLKLQLLSKKESNLVTIPELIASKKGLEVLFKYFKR